MPHTPDDARAAVSEALEARRARPALKIPRGALLLRAVDTETSSGLMIAVLAWAVGLALYLVTGGVVGWILIFLFVALGVVGAARDLAGMRHDLRVWRHHKRDIRVTDCMTEAGARSEPGAGDTGRVVAFHQAIVEGSVSTAAMGVLWLFRELAGDDAHAEEIAYERTPVWPAWLYFQSSRAEIQDDPVRQKDLLAQILATGHPIWATAAVIRLMDPLDEPFDDERVDELREWALAEGDPAVVIELVHYR